MSGENEGYVYTEYEKIRHQEWTILQSMLQTVAALPVFAKDAKSLLLYRLESQSCHHISTDECLTAAYGSPREFWEIECAELVDWQHFSDLFVILVAEHQREIQPLRMFLDDSMLAAHQQGACLLCGDTSSLEHAKFGWQAQWSSLKVDMRKAAEWLLSKPRRRHLVPASLATYLGQPPAPANDQAVDDAPRTPIAAAGISHPKTGPRRVLADKIQKQMIEWVDSHGLPAFIALRKKELPAKFGGKETTCYQVKKEVVCMLTNSDQTLTKDK